ncbi:MAG TPA: Ig-like domain repeat protein, partial [Gemmataceae bacterium]|nr:Ig-like domain repeat protein [Gemmataceae bacterium]
MRRNPLSSLFHAHPGRVLSAVHHLQLEQLEDRTVPSIMDGTILVATCPSTFSYQDQSSFPTGIVGVNPSTGAQARISAGGLFSLPTYIEEAPDQGLYVTDLTAFGTGALIRVDPNTGQQGLVAHGGYINGPNAFAFINGCIYVANEGDGSGAVHNLVRINPSTGQQSLITSGGGFTVPTGLAAAPDDNVYVADEPGGYASSDPGGVWEVDVHTGQQTEIAHGGLIDHPVDIAVDPSGNLVVINTGSPLDNVTGSVVRINPQTGVQTLVTSFGPYSGTDSGAVSRDGSTIFVGAIANGSNPGQIIAVNALTGGQTLLGSGGGLSEVEGIRVFNALVQTGATTTVLSSSANPSLFGQSVTFTATISPQTPSTGTPTGSVQFQIDGNNIGSPVEVRTTAGVTTACISISNLGVGNHPITALYSGDSRFTSSSGTLAGYQSVTGGTGNNVTATLDPFTGFLRISGDVCNNVITITQGAVGSLQVAGLGTTVNQSVNPVSFSPVTGLTITLLNGNDSVTLSQFSLPGNITITAGSGADVLSLDTVLANALSLTTAGPGKDTISLSNTSSSSLTVTAGDNASVALNGVSSSSIKLTAGSNALLSVLDTTSASDLSITLGDNAQGVTVK